MPLTLPTAGSTYSRSSEQERNRKLEAADRLNWKRTEDIQIAGGTHLSWQSPDGDYWAFGVNSDGSVFMQNLETGQIVPIGPWGGGPSGAVSSVFNRIGAVQAQIGDYTAAQVTNAVSTIGSYSNPAWITSLAWSKITGAPPTGVSSVFGRTGPVTAQAGDYTAAQVTNAVDQTQSYANPTWISSLAWSKITGAPNFLVDPTTTTGDIIYRSASGVTRLGIGTAGEVLTVTGGVPVWATPTGGGGGLPAGSDGQVQFNSNGAFGASPNFVWDGNDQQLIINAGNGGGYNVSCTDPTAEINLDLYISDGDSEGMMSLYGYQHSWGAPYAGNLVINSRAAIALMTNNSVTRMFIATGGNIGVGGNINPAYPIDAVGDINITGVYRINGVPIGGAGGQNQTPWLSDIQGAGYSLWRTNAIEVDGGLVGNAYQSGGWVYRSAGSAFQLQTSATMGTLFNTAPAGTAGAAISFVNSLTFADNNCIGVGTVSPQYKLDVAGAVNATGCYSINGNAFACSDGAGGVNLTNITNINGAPPGTGSGGAVASVFGRTGAVIAQAGDYTAAEVTNAVSTASTYADPGWITSLSYSKLTGAPAPYVLPPATATTLGGVIIGSGITVGPDGTISAQTGSQTPWLSNIDAAQYQLNNASQVNFSYPSPNRTGYVNCASNGMNIATGAGTALSISAINPITIASNISINSSATAPAGTAFTWVVTGGITAMSIYANARVSIGLSNAPQYLLDLGGDVNTTGVYRINGVPLAASNITNAVDQTQSYANPAWISSIPYSKITGAPAGYVLPPATATVLGGVKIGANVTVQADGTISVAAPAAPYVLPPATASVLGGIKVGSGLTVQADGTLSAVPGGGSQTPWLSDIQGAGFSLWNANNIQGTNIVEADQALSLNIYWDGSNLRYRGAHPGFLVGYSAGTGTAISTVASGTAGAIATGIAERITFADNGNVGIGTTSPQAQLSVNGTIRVIGPSPAPTSGQGTELQFASGSGWIYPYDRSGNAFLPLRVDGNPLCLNSQSPSKVGIGTASPDQTLTIDGSAPIVEIRSGGYLQMRPSDNSWDMRLQATGNQINVFSGGNLSTPLASFVNGGNVGIGTASPHYQFSVVPNGNPPSYQAATQLWLHEGSNNAQYGCQLGYGYSSSYSWFSVLQSWAGGGGWPLLLNPAGGNVGIGVTNPNSTLSVAGTVLIGSQPGPNAMYLQAFMSGNWGLGNLDTNMTWNGSSYVPINSAYPGMQAGAAVLNNGTGDASWGVSYLPVGSSTLLQLFSVQRYQGSSYSTLVAGGASAIDAQLTYAGQWYTYLVSTTQVALRMRCPDGVYRQYVMNLS